MTIKVLDIPENMSTTQFLRDIRETFEPDNLQELINGSSDHYAHGYEHVIKADERDECAGIYVHITCRDVNNHSDTKSINEENFLIGWWLLPKGHDFDSPDNDEAYWEMTNYSPADVEWSSDDF